MRHVSTLLSKGLPLAALILGLVFTLPPTALHGAPTATPPIKFSVATDKAEYGQGEPIRLTYTLENVSSRPYTVCPIAVGVIHIVQVLHNGRKLRGVPGMLGHVDLAVWDWIQALTVLNPGQRLQFSQEIYPDAAKPSGPSFDEVTVAPGAGKQSGAITSKVITYSSQGPGRYTLDLTYHYSGPTGGNPDVFVEPIRANQLTFTVR